MITFARYVRQRIFQCCLNQVSISSNAPSNTKIHQPGSSSDDITIDPNNQLSSAWCDKFYKLHIDFDSVFEPTTGCYNDSSGRIRARVNILTVHPPTKKLHVPNYSNSNSQLLQSKFDELECQGVFARQEDVNVVVEHVSPSFLVRKQSEGYRLVTAFTTIGQCSKALQWKTPCAPWRYIIVTDLLDSFYQIPLAKESMKWCSFWQAEA